ncbi:MAG: short-chain dehydrogenase [Myxococcaceae bacterium]|nr:short-chain dehydrogenase [Myxococcaceae bacterium]
MKLENATVFITGANRGLGLAFAQEALKRGARKVYAAARDPESIKLPGVVPVLLDVNRAEDVAAAVRSAGDVTLLVNNAGIAQTGGFLAEDSVASARTHFETNVLGPLRLSQAFAPVLSANGGGAILNVLSVVSWITSPVLAVYASSKAAAWSLTNGLRHELRAQKTLVVGLHVGFVDTDMTRGFDVPKIPAALVVERAFDGLEAGREEVLADEVSQQVKRGLSADPASYLRSVGE